MDPAAAVASASESRPVLAKIRRAAISPRRHAAAAPPISAPSPATKTPGSDVSPQAVELGQIAEMMKSAGRIGDAIPLISQIASQTSLLALNATI